MNRTNKKAVSAVVATVLIIMITVAAVGIIWAAIIPMVRDSLSKGTVCNDALSDISIGVEGYTCKSAAYTGCPSTHPYSVTSDDTKCNSVSVEGSSGTNTSAVQLANISLQIKKGSNAKVALVAVNALVFTGGSSESIRINGTNTGTYISGSLPGNNVEQVITLVGAYANATSIKIAPVVTVGKTEETCAATQEVALASCNN